MRPKAGDVLEALAKGITVKKFSPSQAGESDASAAPKPTDPRMPKYCPPCKDVGPD